MVLLESLCDCQRLAMIGPLNSVINADIYSGKVGFSSDTRQRPKCP